MLEPARQVGLHIAIAAALTLPAPALATGEAERLQGVERKIDEGRKRQSALDKDARRLKREIDAMRRRMVNAAEAIQNHEAEVSDLEARLHILSTQAATKREELIDQETRLGHTLAVLQRFALLPTATVLVRPQDPNETIRSALVLRTVVPQLGRRASSLQGELEELTALHREMARKRTELSTASIRLEEERRGLEDLIGKKRRLAALTERERRKEAKRVQRLGREAKTLRDLIGRLEAERKTRLEAERAAREEARRKAQQAAAEKAREEAERKAHEDAVRQAQEAAPETAAPPAETPQIAARPKVGKPAQPATQPPGFSRGALRMPARGRVVRRFGQSNEFGRASKGIHIRTRPAAQVVAPFDGRTVFVGPFRGYGEILIIEHTEGYHTLLAGFSRIDSATGQQVLAGEPIGVMGAAEGKDPTLYVELRENSRPINPLPWLAAQR